MQAKQSQKTQPQDGKMKDLTDTQLKQVSGGKSNPGRGSNPQTN